MTKIMLNDNKLQIDEINESEILDLETNMGKGNFRKLELIRV